LKSSSHKNPTQKTSRQSRNLLYIENLQQAAGAAAGEQQEAGIQKGGRTAGAGRHPGRAELQNSHSRQALQGRQAGRKQAGRIQENLQQAGHGSSEKCRHPGRRTHPVVRPRQVVPETQKRRETQRNPPEAGEAQAPRTQAGKSSRHP